MATRPILALFFRGRWWFASQNHLGMGALVSIPVGGKPSGYVWVSTALQQIFQTGTAPWTVRTRFWDASAPMREKQAINAGLGLTLNGLAASGLTVTVDTEFAQANTAIGGLPSVQWINDQGAPIQWVNNAAAVVTWSQASIGYQLLTGSAQGGNAQYLGLTVSGDADTAVLQLLALLSEQSRDMLQ